MSKSMLVSEPQSKDVSIVESERRLDARDASVLALLARYPDVSRARRRVLTRVLSNDGLLIAKALDPAANKEGLPEYVLQTAKGIEKWVTSNSSESAAAPSVRIRGKASL